MPGATALDRVPVEASLREIGGVCAGSVLVEAPEQKPDGHYTGPRGTAAVVTERGLALVSESGVRYAVPSPEELAALGVLEDGELPVQVPWRVIEPLPDGGELSVERARRTVEVG
ncbi:MAG: type VII secretion protein EccB [Corynebacterium variabile]|nr:type VII secretion protein EccB [Corynebacterium variabile]